MLDGSAVGQGGHEGTPDDETDRSTQQEAVAGVDHGTAPHAIYRDGDPLPTDPGDRDGLREVVESHDERPVRDGRFDRSPDRAVVVLELVDSGNYAAVLVEGTDSAPRDRRRARWQ